MRANPPEILSSELRWTSSLTLIVVLALALRLIWAWWVPVIPFSDGEAYDTFARTLVEHGTFGWVASEPTAFWPPGTTFMHATLYALFGIRYEPIIAMNMAFSVGNIWVTARLAARFWDQQTAVLSAFILAIWPTLVMYPTILASELPFIFLTLLALDIWINPRLGATPRALLVGLILGFAALVRPQALLLPLVYAAALLITSRASLPALLGEARFVAITGIAMAIVIAPWTWRNFQLYGEPVLISTNGGITLWMGNTPGTNSSYMVVPNFGELPENETARVLGQKAKEYILEDPAAFAARAVRKFFLLYANESVGVGWNSPGIRQVFGEAWEFRLKRMTQASWALICLLAAAGIWSSLRRSGLVNTLFSPITLSILYFTAIHMVVVSQDRYHLAFAGQWAMLAALGLVYLATWRQRAGHTKPSRTSGVAS